MHLIPRPELISVISVSSSKRLAACFIYDSSQALKREVQESHKDSRPLAALSLYRLRLIYVSVGFLVGVNHGRHFFILYRTEGVEAGMMDFRMGKPAKNMRTDVENVSLDNTHFL